MNEEKQLLTLDELKDAIEPLNNLTIDAFKNLLDDNFAALVHESQLIRENYLRNKPDIAKLLQWALLKITAVFVQHQTSVDRIKSILQALHIQPEKIEIFLQKYSEKSVNLKVAFSLIGTHPMHITDVKWAINHLIQTSSNLIDAQSPTYCITLNTDQGDISFNCTVAELQDLVYQLKNVTRHCQKVAASLP